MDTLPLQGGSAGNSNGGSSNGGSSNGGSSNGGSNQQPAQGGAANPGGGGSGQSGSAGNGMAGSSMAGEAGSSGDVPDAGGGDDGPPDSGDPDPGDDAVSFSEVYPILTQNCGGCHGNANGLPGFARPVEADAYGETQDPGAQGQLVAQRIIARAVTARTMPPGCNGGQLGQGVCLDADEAALLQAWLADGAQP